MTEQELEIRLLAARVVRAHTSSPFTRQVMQRLKHENLLGQTVGNHNPGFWRQLLRQAHLHKWIAGVVALIVLIAISFSGYAYAIGSDPLTLIKELVVRREVVGKEVRATYDGREFRYGKSLSYSDAAITAFAELNTVDILAFHADNAFLVPQNGIEHVSDPYHTDYIQPWIGTIEKVGADSIVVRKQYVPGDGKLGDSPRQYDEPIVLPAADASLFMQGAPTDFSQAAIGRLVKVYQHQYIRHAIGAGKQIAHVSHYFIFSLDHTLPDIQAVRETGDYHFTDEDLHPIFETYSGGFSDICLNNGADHCDYAKLAGQGGEFLYEIQSPTGQVVAGVNPDAMPLGEAVGPGDQQPEGIILRSLEGTITEITAKDITVKSSSGLLWTLEFDAAKQRRFAQRAKPLKVGQRLGASVMSSVYDLDNRRFDTRHIYEIKRY